jgi:uncharacterized protein YacL
MLDQLRGRNLAHVGCTLGLTLGLVLGLILAFLVLVILNSASGVNWATLVFFVVVFALGALGWVLGDRISRRLWGEGAAPPDPDR